jgi:hypothetical protein
VPLYSLISVVGIEFLVMHCFSAVRISDCILIYCNYKSELPTVEHLIVWTSFIAVIRHMRIKDSNEHVYVVCVLHLFICYA